jgi:hypothetical protein
MARSNVARAYGFATEPERLRPGHPEMLNDTGTDASLYESLMQERDRIRADMVPLPPPERHASIGVFEGWADGVLSDEFLAKYIAKFHDSLQDCPHCADNYTFYKALREEHLR